MKFKKTIMVNLIQNGIPINLFQWVSVKKMTFSL